MRRIGYIDYLQPTPTIGDICILANHSYTDCKTNRVIPTNLSWIRRVGDIDNQIGHAMEKAEEVLAFTGLTEKKNFLGTALTIADKKRLEVSIALATQPRLLMLDESMAGLTMVELRKMIDLIKSIRKNGMTLIVVEHVMEAVMEISDRVVVLNSGKKIMEGSPKEVVCHADVIQAYLGERYVVSQ